MINLYIGEEARKMMQQSIVQFRSEFPDSVVYAIDEENTQLFHVNEILLSTDLFGSTALVVLQQLSEGALGMSIYEELLPSLKETANTIYIFENEFDKKVKEKLSSIGAIIYEKDKKLEKKWESPTVFVLADAYAKGDKRNAWLLLLQQLRSGTSAEEIHGTLFWAIKSMWLSHVLSNSDTERAGIKPFVANKYRTFAKQWKSEAILIVLEELKEMVFLSHRGEGELGVLLEQHILALDIHRLK